MERQQQANDIICDVLVIGSGAAGLACAVTAAHHGLSVVVAEKEPVFGGTSAWSGGWLWVPRNPLATAAGIIEPPDAPMTYLRHELGNRAADPRVATFLANAPDMIGFFAQNSEVAWLDGNKVPDFHETEGHARGGRSVVAAPYDGRKLGTWIAKLRPPLDVTSLWGMGIGSGADIRAFFDATRKPKAALHVSKRLGRHLRDRLVHGRGMQLANGNALVARLMRSALDKGVRLIDSAPATELLREGGKITGARLAMAGGPVSVRAAKGVVLAAGGYPHDPARLDEFAQAAGGAQGHYSAAPRSNSGDGLRLAQAEGAALEGDLESNMALAPVSLIKRPDGSVAHFPHLIERAKPGIIAVTPDGKRFVSEADSYHDFMKALLAATPQGRPARAWLIADHKAQRRWGLGWAKPFPLPLAPALRAGYLKRAQSLRALARLCGIDEAGFTDTITRFNAAAREGHDPEFNRGASAYNRVQGDGDHGPNPSLAPLDTGPFYAVEIVPGSLGSFAGIKTDVQARVLDQDAQPIEGLFAIGNDMASIMGGHYPAGGITLGPGMTFGYIAGRVLAGQPIASYE